MKTLRSFTIFKCMITKTLLFIFIALSTAMQAQVKIEKRYSNHPGAEVKALRQCLDSGFIMVGGDLQAMAIIRTNANGDSIWTKNFDTPPQFGFNIEQCRDSGFIVTGYELNSTCDAFLLKLNADGSTAWKQTYGTGNCEWGQAVKQLADSGYLVVGTKIFRTDKNGNQLWSQTISNQAMSMIITQDSHVVYTSTSSNISSGGWLTKMDLDGNNVWTKSFSNAYFYNNCDNNVAATSDGGYILAARPTNSPGGMLLKTDASGTVEWTKEFNPGTLGAAMSVIEADSGGYATCGFWIDTEGAHAYLYRTDEAGDFLWEKQYAKASGQSLLQTYDGGYAFAGYQENNSGKRKFFLAKIGGHFPLSIAEIETQKFNIYPTLSSGELYVQCEDCFGNLAQVFDAQGRNVETIVLAESIDLSHLRAGIYTIVDAKTHGVNRVFLIR